MRDVAVETPLDDLVLPKLDGKELVAFFKAMELTTITRRVGEICGLDVSAIEPDPRFVGPAGWQGREGEAALAREQEAAAAAPGAFARDRRPLRPARATPADLVRARTERSEGADRPDGLRDGAKPSTELAAWIARAHEAGHVAFDVQTSSPDALQAELIGVSLAVNPGEACYIPIGHRVGADDLFGGGGLVPDQIREEDAIALLKPLMEAPGVLKIGHDVKFGMQVFAPSRRDASRRSTTRC